MAQGVCCLSSHGENCGVEVRAVLLMEHTLNMHISYSRGHFPVALHKDSDSLCPMGSFEYSYKRFSYDREKCFWSSVFGEVEEVTSAERL